MFASSCKRGISLLERANCL